MHGFMMEKSCLMNFTAFYYEMTGLTDEDRAVDAVYLNFSKAFNTVESSSAERNPNLRQ